MKKTKKQIENIARNIRLLIVDVDGVLTDGGIILDSRGNEMKQFHVRDGHGLKMIQREGIQVAIITGRNSKVVDLRAKELGITEVHQGCKKKVPAFEEILEKFDVSASETAYVGDDIVDIPLMVRVGLAVAVADADDDTKEYAMIVTKNPGGRGAVREITDLIIKARGLWDGIIKDYSEI